MRTHWIIAIVLIVCLAAGGVWFLTRSSPESGAPVLRVGVVFPLSGDAASYGEKGRQAIELAKREIDHHLPFSVQVIYEDSRAEPATGVSAVQKLINVDHVQAIVGDIVSAVTLAAAPIAEKHSVVLLSPTSSAPALTNAGEYIYRIWPSDALEGKAIAKWAATKGFRIAAILHIQNDYGVAIADIFTREFEARGGKVVLQHGYSQDTSDFRTPLTQIRQTAPDVLYIAGYYGDSAAILREARQLRLDLQFLGTTAVEDPQFLVLAEQAANGMVYPLATGFDPAATDPKTKQFVEAFNKAYGHAPGWVEAHAYDAFNLIVEAAKRCEGHITGQCIKKGLDAIGPYQGVTGTIAFDAHGDVTKPIQLKTVRDGTFSLLPE